MADSSELTKTTRTRRKRHSKKDPAPLCPNDMDQDQDGCQACACRDDISAMNSKLDKILQTLDAMASRITGIKVKLQESTEKITKQQKEIEELKATVSYLDKQQKEIKESKDSLTHGNHLHICQLEDQIDELQNRSRRNNIVVHGIPEGCEGNQSCEEFLSNFFTRI